MFDHESQSVNWMNQRAKQKGAKVQTAWFKWPTLKPCSTYLKKQIQHKKRIKKNSSKGLFVFPVQSRVTGAKYSYQWMSFAQQNNWYVLLDAGALGPLEMDSLGLSLFRPDFIITSFYRVFGYDPTGFGCLLVKKSAIKILQKQSGHTSSGIVKINPLFTSHLSDSITQVPQFSGDDEAAGEDEVLPETHTGNQLPAFSGVINPSLMRDGEFRLLGRRNAFNFDVEDAYVSNNHDYVSNNHDYVSNEDDYVSEEESGRKEPEITCRHLDHVNMLGLSKTSFRLRFLINWLVTSLLQLRQDGVPLVHIYGPKIKYERGASVAFNVRDGVTGLIDPEIVQKMAEANGISLGVAILSHVKIIQSRNMDVADTTVCRPMDSKNQNPDGFVRAEVVTASLGILTNFEDVYKLWAFVAKFLNPSFVRQYGLSTVMERQESGF
ncbi:hypothetical protein L1987_74909 [Smallanthus sonchifolius]|uniref:Uncharacterized protein n=1 Tax=Smallanthus sonchifolius TaxID=185202 RepID=A0ACB9A4B9_9ASTR|nr:hypothetical protein L1987_74909 [Smallanthus sonchifolius]